MLLQQRHQEVHGHMDVLEKLLLTNLYVNHGSAEAEDLLHLEFVMDLLWMFYYFFKPLTLLRPGPRRSLRISFTIRRRAS